MKPICLLLLCGAMTLLLTTCSNDYLPEPTRVGNNIIGCRINGIAWVPDGGTGFMPAKPISGGFLLKPGLNYKITIEIGARSKDEKQIVLFLKEAKTGVFDLNINTGTAPGTLTPRSYGQYRSPDGTDYVTSSAHTGKITITRADTIAGVISGTFFFEASNSRGEIVKITEGRFDRLSRP